MDDPSTKDNHNQPLSYANEGAEETPMPNSAYALTSASEASVLQKVRIIDGKVEVGAVSESQGSRITGVGSVLDDKYTIVSKIATGGMGVVYRAVHEKLGKEFAVKIITPGSLTNEEAHRRFVREAKASTLLSSPHTVRVFDYNISQWGEPYFVMEFIDGLNLRDTLNQEGAMEPSRAVSVLKQIAQSLVEAHEHGLVHRDLKPSNVMLMKAKGHRDFVKIFDFGVVKFVKAADDMDLTRQGAMLGTPRYMAPEQIHSPEDVTQAADVYSMGLLLYFALTGTKPFADLPSNVIVVQKLDKKLTIQLPSDLDIPKRLRILLSKMTHPKASKRFTAEEVFFELSDIETELLAGTLSGSRVLRLPRQESFIQRYGILLVCLLFFLLGIFGWMFFNPEKTNDPKKGNVTTITPPTTPRKQALNPSPRKREVATKRKAPTAKRIAARPKAPTPARRVAKRRPPTRIRRRSRRRIIRRRRIAQRSRTQRIRISASPASAGIYLGGRLLGKGSASFSKRRRSAVTITIKKSGYFSKKIRIPANSKRFYSVRLKEIRIYMP